VGHGHPTEDHAVDLLHVREVHDVVHSLRRLLVAANQADEAAVQVEAAGAARPIDPFLQSPPGR
jgi:hypothetical protein